MFILRELITKYSTIKIIICIKKFVSKNFLLFSHFVSLIPPLAECESPLISLRSQVTTHKKPHVLGILDIYGFEAFQQNGFEQLLINYANERLQQLFIDTSFKAEQEEYLSEGVEWTQVGFFSNAVICQLMDTPGHGMFSLLDEASGATGDKHNGANNSSHSGASSDEVLASLNSGLAPHPHYEPSAGAGDPEQLTSEPESANPVPPHSFR